MVRVVHVDEFGAERTIAVSGNDKHGLLEAKTHYELNSASSASLVFPNGNPLTGILESKNPVIAIYKDTRQMFVGSIAGDVKTDIFGRKTVNLDGAMSWLKNICKPPFSVSTTLSVAEYLSRLITQYNEAVAQNRQLILGGVTVSGNVVVDHSSEYTKIGELFTETVKEHGGYLSETFQGKGLSPRIDYFAESLMEDPTPLAFGVDLAEFEQCINYDDYASRVYAVGKDGITATAINSEAEKQFGRVDYPLRSEAETVSALQAEADAVLAQKCVPLKTVAATALSASGCVPGLVKRLVDYRRQINTTMMVYSVDLDLLNPSQNKAAFGVAPTKTYTNTRNLIRR